MEVDGANARRSQARPTTQQKEEWERAGFDVALAEALFARPFLAPAPATTPRASAPETGGETHAEAARGRAEQTAQRQQDGGVPLTARFEPPEDSGAAPKAAEERLEPTPPPEVKADLPDRSAIDAPGSDVVINNSFTAASRASSTSSSAPRLEVDGAAAIGAGSRTGERSSGEREATPEQARPEPPPTLRPSTEEAAKAARIFRPVEVTFDAGDGQEGRLRVSVQGQAVRATILAPDAPMARQLERSAPDLRRALREKGFRKAEVSIRSPRDRAPADNPDAPSRVAESPER